MTENLPEIQVSSEAKAVIKMDGEVTDRVAWITEQIADAAYEPGHPDQPWAGRMEIVRKTMEEFKVDEVESDRLVKLAHAELWAHTKDNTSHVRRRLMLVRLSAIRDMVINGLTKDKVIRHFGFKIYKGKDGNPPKKMKYPKKEIVTSGMDWAGVRILLEIEDMIARLTNMETEGENEGLMAEIFSRIDKDSEGVEKNSTSVSISQRIKNSDISKLSPAAQQLLMKAIDQNKSKQAKKVKSFQPPGEDRAKETGTNGGGVQVHTEASPDHAPF